MTNTDILKLILGTPPEEMTVEQLIAVVRKQWAIEATLRLLSKEGWAAYENANGLVKSYMEEFEARGLVYTPKLNSKKGV